MDELQKSSEAPEAARPGERMARLTLTVLTLVVAGAGSWLAATRIADEIEAQSLAQARAALTGEELPWARISTNGLNVQLSGTAPDEMARFRALSAVGSRIDDRRIEDRMEVAERALLDPPDFSLELMRQGPTLSLIGLLPERTDRKAMAERLSKAGTEITDLTGTAAFPPPESWRPALDFGLQAAETLEQGTISVTPGLVQITANAASPEEKAQIEAELSAAQPDGVKLAMTVSSPLPIIAPYRLRLVRTDGVARLENCAAETAQSRERILAAAIAAGADPASDCMLGIGAPSGWERAVLAALNAAGQGRIDMIDETLHLTLPVEMADDTLTAVQAELDSTLPANFKLDLQRAEAAPEEGPARFTAEIGATPPAIIAGVLPNATMRQTVQSLARAQLGPVEGELKLDLDIPDDWPLRVMAGLDAMGALDRGRLLVTPQRIEVSGVSGDPFATEKAVTALAVRIGAGVDYTIAIAYDRRLDPEIEQPDGTTCVDRLNTVMLESEIGFEPGGARIAGDIAPVLDDMRQIMKNCADFRIEIGGHTDAQGSEATNMALSLGRAEAVLDALNTAGLPVQNMVAAGYGETRPIAENDTQEGRDANRRIEMVLLSPDPVPLPEPEVQPVTGRTLSAEAATEALMAAVNAVPLQGDILPEPLFGTEALAAPPKIEPAAEVLVATPDTPRPPDRPDAHQPADASAKEAQ